MASTPGQLAAQARYRKRHTEQQRARNREYHASHRQEIRARHQRTRPKYYEENRERILARGAKYHAEHRDAIRAQQRTYRLAHLEERREHCRAWHAAHKDDPAFKEQHRLRNQADYQANREKRAKQHREWRQKNRGHWRALRQKRRALEKGAAINLAAIAAWMAVVRGRRTASCYYCQNQFPAAQVHFDHIVALSRGGSHSVENLCVACPTCNLRKSARPLRTWVKMGQQLLEL